MLVTFAHHSEKNENENMQVKIWTILVATLLVATACSELPEQVTLHEAKSISVTIASGGRMAVGEQSRIQLGDDGQTVAWERNDQISLWAVTNSGEEAFAPATLSLRNYDVSFQRAHFTGDIPAMAAGDYTYSALYPLPESTRDQLAQYTLPATQNGEFNSAYDIMVADPIQGGALVEGVNEHILLSFHHKVHLLKISIPDNQLGEPISAIQLRFPRPVVGTLTIDPLDPNGRAMLTNASTTLRLQFDQPKQAGDVVYATIVPFNHSADEHIEIHAITEIGESETRYFTSKTGVFAAGHTTPIRYHVPSWGLRYTTLTFALPADKGKNTLGEAVEQVTVTAPSGSLFPNGSNTMSFSPDASGQYKIVLKPSLNHNLSGKTLAVQYESKSAVVSTSTTVQVADYQDNTLSLSVPYLFYEDFSTVDTISSNDGYTGGFNSGSKNAVSFLSGWTGGRFGAQAGTAIRIACRRETSANYGARVDSAPLKNLKAGATAKVQVTFNYSMNRQEGGIGSAPKLGQTFFLGYVNSNTAYKSGDNSGTFDGGTYINETTGSYTNINHTGSYQISQASNTTRMSWRTINESKAGLTNGTFWFYIDNVKVTIIE